MMPTRAYLICTTPRSGSWLLAESLLVTGVAGLPEEYLRPDWYERFHTVGCLEYQHRLHRMDPWPDGIVPRREATEPGAYRAFLRAVLATGTTDNGVFAAKVHRHQLERAVQLLRSEGEPTSDAELVRRWLPDARFVFLRRVDTIRRAISHYRAIHSDIWWQNSGDAARTRDPEISPEDIERLRVLAVAHDHAWERFFQRAAVQPLVLHYEDVAMDAGRAVRQVLNHIGIEPSSVRSASPSRLVRQADAWTDHAVHAYVGWKRATRTMTVKHYGADHYG